MAPDATILRNCLRGFSLLTERSSAPGRFRSDSEPMSALSGRRTEGLSDLEWEPEAVQEARDWPRDGPGRMGFGTLLCTVGSKRRREGKECFVEGPQGVRRAVFRGEEPEPRASQGILFLLAWQMIAVQKACQSPCAPLRGWFRLPDRCGTGVRLRGGKLSRRTHRQVVKNRPRWP